MRIGPISADPLQPSRDLAWPAVRETQAASSQAGMDLVVLSSPAYEAVSGRTEPPAGQAYEIVGRSANGQMNITPGTAPGTMRIVIDVQDGSGRNLHVETQVRSSWVQAVAGGPGENPAQATRLLEAIARVATIEGQTTVAVTASPPQEQVAQLGLQLREALQAARVAPAVPVTPPRKAPFEPLSIGTPPPPPDRALDPFGTWGAPIRGPVRPVYPQVWLPAEYPPPPDDAALVAELRGEA